MSLKLDPRTKLYMIFVVSAVVMMSATTPFLWAVMITITIIPIFLLIMEKHYAAAFQFLIFYGTALLLTFKFLSENSEGFLSAFLVGYCGIIVQFMPAMITAWYVVRTTKIGEFVCAMQKMHIPDGITISSEFFASPKGVISYIPNPLRNIYRFEFAAFIESPISDTLNRLWDVY